MVVVAVCPVHGAQRSQGFNLSNSVGVTLAGNMETCSVQGCGRMARTMDGSYNFLHASTEVISAPQWSIKALREVAPKLGETIRLLASPSTTADEARKAVEDVTPQVEKAVEGLPLPLSKKIVNALELSPWGISGRVAKACWRSLGRHLLSHPELQQPEDQRVGDG